MCNHKFEIQNLSRLRGTPQIVQIHSILVDKVSLIILTEYINQQTLKSCFSNFSHSFRIQIRQIFKELLRAVLRCHLKKIIHRDIKMENILYGSERGIVLIDFGLSVDLTNAWLDRKLSTAGTPVYMAPELFSDSLFHREHFNYYLDILLDNMILIPHYSE